MRQNKGCNLDRMAEICRTVQLKKNSNENTLSTY